MWKIVLPLLLVITVNAFVTAKGLPSYLKICKRNDPIILKCVVENVEILRPRLKQGIPELFIPSLDPLLIPEATLSNGDSFTATFKDIQMYNTHEFTLQSFDIDLTNYHINLKIQFPKLRIKSTYIIHGRLLILNLDGKGAADGNYTNVQASLALKGAPFQKNNKEYVRWEKEMIGLSFGKISLLFERIFGDNKELNDQTNKVINENINSIVEELMPVVKQVANNFVFSIVNRLFARYPISELFPSA